MYSVRRWSGDFRPGAKVAFGHGTERESSLADTIDYMNGWSWNCTGLPRQGRAVLGLKFQL